MANFLYLGVFDYGEHDGNIMTHSREIYYLYTASICYTASQYMKQMKLQLKELLEVNERTPLCLLHRKDMKHMKLL